MLMMTGEEIEEVEAPPEELPLFPPLSAALFNAGKAALLVEKVPTASMSRTVRKPFEERASAEAKKLPAAQLTSTSSAASRDLAVATATHRSTSSGFLTSPWIPEMFLTPLECKSATAASRTAWRRPVTKTEAPWRPEREFFFFFFCFFFFVRISMA